MKKTIFSTTLLLLFVSVHLLLAEQTKKTTKVTKTEIPAGPEIVIAQYMEKSTMYSGRAFYPRALTSLLTHIKKETTINVRTEPVIIQSFQEDLSKYPFIYVNFAQREKWEFSSAEKLNLKKYLENGGFLYIDSGISASFLRGDRSQAQHHSFAEWDAVPELKKCFGNLFPGSQFKALKRTHPIFRAFYKGLPDTTVLPDTVRSFVEEEKWPGGTYSTVGLKIDGRLAVIATPILAMGWGKDQRGLWINQIRLRIREQAKGLNETLKTAGYDGHKYQTICEDGTKDTIYCQNAALPAWVQESSGRWRIFRYYASQEISDFSHRFYTRLGTNFLVYAMTH